MKTLDEVIESITKQSGLEIRNIRKADKDRFWVDRETYNDALFYLKEYRTLQYGYIKAMADLEDNPALTMEDFSQMIDTEPIWCHVLQEWYLFLAYDDGENEIQLMTDEGDIETFDEKDIEKYPLYRRKP